MWFGPRERLQSQMFQIPWLLWLVLFLSFVDVDMVRLLLLPSLPSHDGVSPMRVQTASAGPRVLVYPDDLASSAP